MRRLRTWFVRLISKLTPEGKQAMPLPFESEELARLIQSGSREDFAKLAAGFSRRIEISDTPNSMTSNGLPRTKRG